MNFARTTTVTAVLAVALYAGSPYLNAQAPAATQAARPVPPKSPDIHPDRTVTFRLMAPATTTS